MQKRADRSSQQREQTESQERQMERQGHIHTAASSVVLFFPFRTSCVTQILYFLVNAMQRATRHFSGMNPRAIQNPVLIHVLDT